MVERCFNFAPDGWCDAWILRLMAVLFLQKAMADGFGLRRQGCGGNDETDYSSKVIRMICLALRLLQLLAIIRRKGVWSALWGGEIPAKILSLLLPPNKIATWRSPYRLVVRNIEYCLDTIQTISNTTSPSHLCLTFAAAGPLPPPTPRCHQRRRCLRFHCCCRCCHR